jgi:hypothetical protein
MRCAGPAKNAPATLARHTKLSLSVKKDDARPVRLYSVIPIGIAAAIAGLVVLIAWLTGQWPALVCSGTPDCQRRGRYCLSDDQVWT